MNPSELRMMWMSQYNPERISLEDAASYFGQSSVGLSVMDDSNQQSGLVSTAILCNLDFRTENTLEVSLHVDYIVAYTYSTV